MGKQNPMEQRKPITASASDYGHSLDILSNLVDTYIDSD